MIRSMTGFGAAEVQSDQWTVRAELRSVNHRDLQVSFRLPDAFYAKEVELQKLLEQHVRRGHVRLTLAAQVKEGRADVLVDSGQLEGYLRVLKDLAARQDVPARLEFAALLRLPGVLRDVTTDPELHEQLWPAALEAIRAALAGLIEMRTAEGANLAAHLREVSDAVEEGVARIERAAPEVTAAYRDRLKERVEKLLAGTSVPVAEDSLAREVAFFAERSDVSEEVARLRSHLAQFREALDSDEEAVGRRLEFIGQEMLREANTMAAKLPAGDQIRDAMELKGQIDRVREQVRNVE
jgi:uncharacterized protein (TIGR00255 family)